MQAYTSIILPNERWPTNSISAKLVDDIMETGRNENEKKFLKAFGENF